MTSRIDSSPSSGTTRPERGLSLSRSTARRSVRRRGRRSEWSRGPHARVSPRRLGLPEAPTEPGSPEKSTLRLGVIDALPRIQFRQPPLGLRQEDQALDRVLQRGVRWQLLDHLKNFLFGAAPRHWRPLGCSQQHRQNNRIRGRSPWRSAYATNLIYPELCNTVNAATGAV